MALDYTILAPQVVTKVVSRILTPGNILQWFFGFGPGGANVAQDAPEGVRQYTYDIFDNVRSIAKGRSPGTGPATVARNPVGINTVTIARSYEKIPDMSYEVLSNIRRLGESATTLDKRGMAYLEAQGKFLAQRQTNFREFLTWGLTRGSCQFLISGDDWIPVLSGGTVTIDFKIPAGNLSSLNMLGAGNIIAALWSNAATDIPGQLDGINIAFQQLVGAPLAWVLTDSTVWRFVLKNTAVQNQAGSVNTPYADYDMEELRGPDGNRLGLIRGTIKAIPWLQWYITDAGLEVNGTFTKFYDGTKASFGVDPAVGYAKMQEGAELVKESPWAAPAYQRGFHGWLREWDEPARVELHSINNLVPELTVPKAIALGTVA